MAKGPERWKEVEGYPNYMVSSHGRVWSRNRNRCLRPGVKNNGYLLLILCSEGVCRPKMLHRLVAQAFLENPGNLPEVNHLDGDKANNDVSNLEWTDHQGNMRHAYRTGLIGRAKARTLDEARVEELKGLYATGEWTQRRLAEKYGISQRTVCNYVRGVPSPRRLNLPPETKREMFRLYSTGEYTLRELGSRFGVSYSTVYRYVRHIEDSQ